MKFPKLDMEARDSDDKPMDSLIKSLLDEEQASKKQKKADGVVKPVAPTKQKQQQGKKTLAEIEAEEGGPVKESLVGMAQTKRAIKRKKQDDGNDQDMDKETEFQLDATERFEEVLEQEEEDGVQLEPFNLEQEREEGTFDADGNYVERKRGEDEEDKDAWFESDEAKVVSAAVRSRILAQQRELAEAEKARRPPLTDRQIAQRKADMAALMQPGESVTRALKRLGDASGSAAAGLPQRAMGKRERTRLLAQQQQQQADGGSADDSAAKQAREHFQTLAELADELLAEGELEIYGESQDSLTRSARMWLQPAAVPAAAAQGDAANGRAAAAAAASAAGASNDADDDMFGDGDGGAGSSGAAKAAAPTAATAEDGDEDMFGDREGKSGADAQEKPSAAPTSSPPAGAGAGAPSATTGHTPAAQNGSGASASGHAEATATQGAAAAAAMGDDGVDYGSWPIKELKRLLQERGVDPSGYVEKAELVAKVKEVTGAGQGQSVGPGSGAGGTFAAPPGYAFDPSSGYFANADSGMYFDTSTGYYCQAATGKWFYIDSQSRQFVEYVA